MKTMVKNSLYNIMYTLTNVFFSLLSSVYVSRILQPEGIGKYTYVLTFATYFVSFASLGIPVYGVREIAKACTQEEKNRVFSELFILNLLTSIVALIVYIIVIFKSKAIRDDIGLYMRFSLLIVSNILNIDWLYKGEESYGYIATRSAIVKTCSILLLILWVHDSKDVYKYADITILASCGNYICNIFHAKRYVKLSISDLNFKRHLKPNAILAVSTIFGEIYNKIDITMLGLFSTEHAVGIYGNAHKIVNIIITCCAAITATFLPRVSSVAKENKRKTAQLVNKGLEILAFLCIPFAVGLCSISSKAVLLLYGEDFLDTAVTIRFLSALILIRGIGDLVCYQLLVGIGQEKLRIKANIITTLLNIGLNRLLIPQMGENGAALASVISELFVNGYLYAKMRKIVSFDIHIVGIIQAAFSSLAMYSFVWLIGKLRIPLLTAVLVSILGGSAVYAIANCLLKNPIMLLVVDQTKDRLKALQKRK